MPYVIEYGQINAYVESRTRLSLLSLMQMHTVREYSVKKTKVVVARCFNSADYSEFPGSGLCPPRNQHYINTKEHPNVRAESALDIGLQNLVASQISHVFRSLGQPPFSQ